MNRRELVDVLITELEYDPKILLESLVAALSDDEAHAALEYVSRVEDWEWRVDENGELINQVTGKKWE